MPNRPVHFEIQVDDIARAKKFYGGVFGWEFQDWPMPGGEPYIGVITAPKESKEPGINGGMLKRPCPAPKPEQGTNAYVTTMVVENFDEIAKKILAAGGIVALPKFAIAGMAWQGYFLDTECNTFGIHQADKNAH
ncbi:MAG: VOC family protein [bacterium]|nr:VOC family protein [bacterium]